MYVFGRFELDAAARRLSRNGEHVPMSDRHVGVLLELVSRPEAIVSKDALIDAVLRDGERTDSSHDMGGDIIPAFVDKGTAGVYDLKRNDVPGSTDRDRYYWRDVGTIDSFFEAHQDLISTLPVFNLYNMQWPIHSQAVNSPPAKFVRDSVGRIGNSIDSIVSLRLSSGSGLIAAGSSPWRAGS